MSDRRLRGAELVALKRWERVVLVRRPRDRFEAVDAEGFARESAVVVRVRKTCVFVRVGDGGEWMSRDDIHSSWLERE